MRNFVNRPAPLVIFRNDYDGGYVLIPMRSVAGDLVVRPTNNHQVWEVDQSPRWLFAWERNNPNCYARRKQKERFIRRGKFISDCR